MGSWKPSRRPMRAPSANPLSVSPLPGLPNFLLQPPSPHRVPALPGSRRPWWCIILSLGYGLQVLGKDTATGSYFIVTDNYRLL